MDGMEGGDGGMRRWWVYEGMEGGDGSMRR